MTELKKEVIVSDTLAPLPKVDPIKPLKVEVGEAEKVVLTVFYLMLKGNLLTDHNIRELLQEMSKPLPEQGIAKYLVERGARA